jgi:gamma-glutamyl-gamma-aminobutyrate hydrolase PuuD
MRIGISQRVDSVPDYHEIRDGLDHQWILFLEQVGLQVVVLPNRLINPAQYYEDLQLEGLILSGGNDPGMLQNPVNLSEERDFTELTLLNTAIRNNHPVVGVCRGMQFMCLQSGEKLSKIEGHVASRHHINTFHGFQYPSGHEVNSYHNWALKSLSSASPWQILARTDDASIEAVGHKNQKLHGIMWHPERESDFSKYDINYFKDIFKND